MSARSHNLLVVLGPTASRKTRIGVALAREFGGEIVSADSRQVYRGLDIGTGKDLGEYGSGADRVAYHLIDVVDPHEEYNVFRFQRDFFSVFVKLHQRDVLPVLVGGTGLYLEAVLKGYEMVEAPENPELRAELLELDFDQLVARLESLRSRLHNTTNTRSRERLVRAIEIAVCERDHPPRPLPELRPLVLGTRFEREDLYRRINRRLAERLDSGLIEEVESLAAESMSRERLFELGLEYRFVADFLHGRIGTKEELEEKLSQAIRRFASRQLSWYRRMERRGTRIHWIDNADPDEAVALVRRLDRTEVSIRPGL